MKSLPIPHLSRKTIIPLAIAAVSLFGAFVIVATAPSVEHKEPERAIPTVRTIYKGRRMHARESAKSWFVCGMRK